jgi:hypothetical protein
MTAETEKALNQALLDRDLWRERFAREQDRSERWRKQRDIAVEALEWIAGTSDKPYCTYYERTLIAREALEKIEGCLCGETNARNCPKHQGDEK